MAGESIDPNKIRVGDVILVANTNKITRKMQEKLGFGDSSQWTHVAGSIGGVDLVEGNIPKSRVCSLQKDYVDKGYEIKVLRPQYQTQDERIKVALWWATMNNMPYDILQLAWFPFAGMIGKSLLWMKNIFDSKKRLICSELIANGFYKQAYNIFDKPAADILPADYDGVKSFQIVDDVWLLSN